MHHAEEPEALKLEALQPELRTPDTSLRFEQYTPT